MSELSPATALHPSLLSNLLRDPRVTDICFNKHNEVFFERGNGLERWEYAAELFHSENEYRTFVLENISKSGKTWDAKLPFVDTVFFGTHRAHVSFPPLAQYGIYLSLRKLPVRRAMDDGTGKTIQARIQEAQTAALARWSAHSLAPPLAATTSRSTPSTPLSQTSDAFQTLIHAIQNHETILLAGGTGSGKTTLLNDLLSFADASERIIALEDTAEISPEHPHFLSLLSRPANADGFGAVSLRDLLKQTLRMRPDRILLGECRGEEVLDLLQALNTGHRGTLCTLHANSSRDALKRIELLALLGAKGIIPAQLIRELMANGIQKIVYLKRIHGVRTIQSIIQLEGREGDTLLSRPLWNAEVFTKERPVNERVANVQSV